MVQNKDFLGSFDTNLYYFRHFDINHFLLYYNGKPIPSEGLQIEMVHEKTLVMTYRTLRDRSFIIPTRYCG